MYEVEANSKQTLQYCISGDGCTCRGDQYSTTGQVTPTESRVASAPQAPET